MLGAMFDAMGGQQFPALRSGLPRQGAILEDPSKQIIRGGLQNDRAHCSDPIGATSRRRRFQIGYAALASSPEASVRKAVRARGDVLL